MLTLERAFEVLEEFPVSGDNIARCGDTLEGGGLLDILDRDCVSELEPALYDLVRVNLPDSDAMCGWNGALGMVTKVEDSLLYVEGDGFSLWADPTQLKVGIPDYPVID